MFDSQFVLNILACILWLVIVLTAMKIFGELIDSHFSMNYVKFFIWMLLLAVELFVAYCLMVAMRSNLETRVETGYSVYLDGQEVDAENIEFSQYNCYVNDEEKAIMLTPK